VGVGNTCNGPFPSRLRKYFLKNCSIITFRNMFNYFFFSQWYSSSKLPFQSAPEYFQFSIKWSSLFKGRFTRYFELKEHGMQLEVPNENKEESMWDLHPCVPLWICTKHHHHLHHLFLSKNGRNFCSRKQNSTCSMWVLWESVCH